jgi:hypothetical protein
VSPYVVTTKRRDEDQPGVTVSRVLSRRAVATLGEARGLAALSCGISNPEHLRAASRLPESGGTVGPLPDGTVIQVERVTWAELLPMDERPLLPHMTQRELLDAYNARQS